MRRIKYFLGALLAFLLLFNLGGVGYAGSPGAILVDRSHGQAYVDFVGFTAYLVSQGWIVADATESITSDVLSGYAVFLMPRPSEDLKSAEVEAIRSFVENGGGLWMLEDSGSLTRSNSISSQFGVTFNSDLVYDETYNSGGYFYRPIISNLEPHSITDGVSSFVYYGGCSLNVVSPASVIAKGSSFAYSDRDIYGAYPPVLAAAEVGSGRAVFIGDMSALRSSKYDKLSDEHKRLLANIVGWLGGGGASNTIAVAIDIKPGGNPNSINLKSKGVVPVAILTTETFDATTVDPLSVEFGPDGAMEAHGRGHIEDVDGDGDLDLVLHFKTQDTGIACGDATVSLTGETLSGEPIEGSDLINTVGCK